MYLNTSPDWRCSAALFGSALALPLLPRRAAMFLPYERIAPGMARPAPAYWDSSPRACSRAARAEALCPQDPFRTVAAVRPRLRALLPASFFPSVLLLSGPWGLKLLKGC